MVHSSNWFELASSGSGSGSGELCWFWFWFSKFWLRTRLGRTLATLDVSSKVSDNGNKSLSSPSDDHQYINVQLYGKRKYKPDKPTPDKIVPPTEYTQPIKKVKIHAADDPTAIADSSVDHGDMPLGLQ